MDDSWVRDVPRLRIAHYRHRAEQMREHAVNASAAEARSLLAMAEGCERTAKELEKDPYG